jgi:hypothetical protein
MQRAVWVAVASYISTKWMPKAKKFYKLRFDKAKRFEVIKFLICECEST